MIELAIGKTECGHSDRRRRRAVVIGLLNSKLHYMKVEVMSNVVMRNYLLVL